MPRYDPAVVKPEPIMCLQASYYSSIDLLLITLKINYAGIIGSGLAVVVSSS